MMLNLVSHEMEVAWPTLRAPDDARIIGQTGLAWLLAAVVFQGGLLLGLG